MKPHEIKVAAEALSDLRNHERDYETLLPFNVVAIVLSREEKFSGGHGEITLGAGRGGSGSVTGIGYPEDLRAAMTKALMEWASLRIRTSTARAKNAGVDVDDNGGAP